jgi:DNA-binding MarR family transcriptional regulator
MFSRYRSSIWTITVASAIVISNANYFIGALSNIPTATASHLELAARLRLSITRLARRLRQHTGEGLSPSQASALASIERRGPMTPSELAAVERIQRPTATRILSALVEADLVTRETAEGDRRSANVRITREGSSLLGRARQRKTAYLARRLETLDPDDLRARARAAEVLERLIEDEA